MKIQILNLPANTTDTEVRELFHGYARTDAVTLIKAGNPEHPEAVVDLPVTRPAANLIADRIKGLEWKGKTLDTYVLLFFN